MLAYFDTSALVPLLIDEPSTARCTESWNDAQPVASSTIAYVEVHSALAVASDDDFVAVSGNRDLLEAWSELGVATIDTAR